MKTLNVSASNQFKGKISEIKKGPINGRVMIDIGNGHILCSVMPVDAITRLDLDTGVTVYGIISSSDVMVIKEDFDRKQE